MNLNDSPVRATIAVSAIAPARDFYEGKLGLSPMEGGPDEIKLYQCGGDTVLQVYESPEHAGKATATLASFSVDDLPGLVDELTAAGVTFAQYDAPEADDKGIHTFGEHQVTWTQDPDGNTIAIDNGR